MPRTRLTLVCLLFVAVLSGAVVFLKLATHERNIATFAEIGSVFADPTALPAPYPVRQGYGADGQF